MVFDRYARNDVAERIAATENRIAKLRSRVDRLQREGSSAHRDQEILASLSGTLGDLYSRQSSMRRSTWMISRWPHSRSRL